MFLTVAFVMALTFYTMFFASRLAARGWSMHVMGKFVFHKYRAGTYYWAAAVTTRSLLLSLVQMVTPDKPLNQMSLTIVILVSSAILTAGFMPFRVPFLNATEVLMCFALAMIMAVSSA